MAAMTDVCMPGMVMPGCRAPLLMGRAMGGPTVIEIWMFAIIVLSAYGGLVFEWRYLVRAQIPHYSGTSEWLGHAAHAPGMIAMALLMMGTFSTIGPLSIYMGIYGLFGVVFLVRWFSPRHPSPRGAELRHAFVNASMVYMFSFSDVALVTLTCLLLYGAAVALEVWGVLRAMPVPSRAGSAARNLNLVGVTGTLALGVSMMLMLAVMQWAV
jgi:hypothetical protein